MLDYSRVIYENHGVIWMILDYLFSTNWTLQVILEETSTISMQQMQLTIIEALIHDIVIQQLKVQS